MKIITKRESQEWCRVNSVTLDNFSRPKANCETQNFDIPSDAGQRVAMVANLFHIFQDEDEFLVWFTEWSVWQSGERMHIFDRFRLSYGEKRPLIDSPAHIFTRAEFEDAVSFVTLGVLFLWDCYVVNRKGDRILFYSHDEFGYKTKEDRVEPVNQGDG
jgi:hypothetical protein